jgi:uncharacterized protein YdhG (YjbR/CyaY superfamily)
VKTRKQEPVSINEYISSFPRDVRKKLTELRTIIRNAAPEAQEKMSYRIPTFVLHGNLVHFAAYARHIGFYPGSRGVRAFMRELSTYETSKGTVRFPLEEPLPKALIRKIVKFRVGENSRKKVRKRTTHR